VKHRHRIIPGHEGGKYSDNNVVELTPTQHAMWHFAEWKRKGKWEDKVAWQGLSGIISHEEAIALAMSKGGKKGGTAAGRLYSEVGLSEAHKKNIGNGVRGLVRSDEDRKHKSEAARARWARSNARDFVKENEEKWKELLAPYDWTSRSSASQAAKDLGVTSHCIRKNVRRLGLRVHGYTV